MKTTHQSITTLPDSPEQDRKHRLSRYVWQMAVRVVLFVAAVLVWSTWHTWLAVVPIALAGIIPWVAVVIANAGSHAEGEILSPGGAVERIDLADTTYREQVEAERAAAYRAEQERLREQAQHEQEQWQKNGDRSRVWGRR